MRTRRNLGPPRRRVKKTLAQKVNRLKWRIIFDWEEFVEKLPWVPNEGEATARAVNMAFDRGYPMEKDYETPEAMLQHLQNIWDIVDNWDGSRVNVEWANRGIPAGWLHSGAPGDTSPEPVLGSPHDFEAQGTGIAALGVEPVVPEELD